MQLSIVIQLGPDKFFQMEDKKSIRDLISQIQGAKASNTKTEFPNFFNAKAKVYLDSCCISSHQWYVHDKKSQDAQCKGQIQNCS